MSIFVFTNGYVMVNAVDLSDHVDSVKVNVTDGSQEYVQMGSGTLPTLRLPTGVQDWSADIEFKQDYAASKVDATIWGCRGTAVALHFKPVNAAISATNPDYTGNGLLTSYEPVNGAFGEITKTTAHFDAAAALDRDVTP
jgi:hypothetical protein